MGSLNKYEVNCTFCNELKYVSKWDFEHKQRHFCNRDCLGKWNSEFQKGEDHPNWTKITVECAYCGTPKQIPKCQFIKAKRFYCNQKCQMAWRSENQSGANWSTYSRVPVNCTYCEKEKFVKPHEINDSKNGRFFCNQECMVNWRKESGVHAKENNVNWRGGEFEVWYDDYKEKLQTFEETRRDPNNQNLLQVKCTYCGKWINPKRHNVFSRIAWFEGRASNENRFYCEGDGCKKLCPIYGQELYPKGYLQNTSREVQPELRQLCFKRDNWTCQRCGATENLHCHHLEGIMQNPIESADLDMVITVCASCHNVIHSQIGCRRSDLRCSKTEEIKI